MSKRSVFIILPIVLLIFFVAFSVFKKSSQISKNGMGLAEGLIEKGEYDSAIGLLSEEEKKNPNEEISFLLAKTYLKMGEYLSAEQKCQEILNNQPNNKKFLNLLLEIKFETGKHYWQRKNRSLACSNLLWVLDHSPSPKQISEIAFLTGGNYYLKRLTNDLIADYYPSFSHKGEKIIYHSDTSFLCEDFGLEKKIVKKSQIFILDFATGKKVCISSDDTSEQNPRFSWDDKKIVYEKEIPAKKEKLKYYSKWIRSEQQKEIFLKDLDTGQAFRLTNNDCFDGLPNFSPDNHKIIFVHDDPDSNISTLYQLNLDTMKREKVIPPIKTRFYTHFAFPYYPSFSPAGKKVLFQAGFRESKIYLVDLEEKSLKNLSTSESEDFYPSFSPDGRKIVFVSIQDEQTEIYLMSKDGSSRTRLTFDGTDKKFPAFSPDGKKIVFVAKQPEEEERYLELYVLDLTKEISQEQLKERIKELSFQKGV